MIFQDKTILITGGTGSLGKALVHRIMSGKRGEPQKIIIFSRDEIFNSNLIFPVYLKRIGHGFREK